MKKILLILLSFILLSFFACSQIKDEGMYAEINTSMGKIVCKLYFEKTPITVGNFVGLAEGEIEHVDINTYDKVKSPFYDGLIFHRVVKDFVIQGGCPFGDGRGTPGYSFVDEFDDSLKHDKKGILSMANSGPNTNGSQFFITLKATPHLDNQHTVFGEVVDGLDVLDKIANVNVDENSKPYKDIFIKKIVIKRVGDKAKSFDAVSAFAKNEIALEKLNKEKEIQMNAFLQEIGVNLDEITTTEVGMKYFLRKKGTGKKPQKGDTIVAHYTGYLEDGTIFDSSVERNEPFETQIGVGRVIPGWDEAFIDMQEGEKRVLILPYFLAYGENGYPPVIPPKATLIFDVELIKVK